ncbi:MAG: 50S ribosomal protein L23 [Candidatus Paceibacterota bacterium]|jgi:large subunit ribosomal protein L23
MKNTQENNHILSIVKKPRITEKAGIKSESQNVYTFEVTKCATKKNIGEAIKLIYKVTPIKVNIVNLPAKNVTARGRRGVKQAVKKALVFLKKGDKIAFI